MTVTNDDDPPDRVPCLQCGTLIERQKFRPTGAVVCPYCHRVLALGGAGTVNAPDKSAETYRRPARTEPARSQPQPGDNPARPGAGTRPLKITLPLPREPPPPPRENLPLPASDPIQLGGRGRPRRRYRKLVRAVARGLQLLSSTRSATWLTAIFLLLGGFVFLVLGVLELITLERLVSVFRR